MLQNLTVSGARFPMQDLREGNAGKAFPLIALPLLLGVVVGCCIGTFSSLPEEFASLTELLQESSGEIDGFPASLRSFRLVFLSILLAFTLYGVVLIPPLSLLRGFLLGCSVAAVFQAESFRGLALCALTIGLPALLNIPAFLLAATDAFRISSRLLRLLFRNRRENALPRFLLMSHALLLAAFFAVETMYICFLLPLLLRAFKQA